MNSNQSLDQEEAFALEAYGSLPGSQPPAALDARILAAAHAANGRVARSPRRWTTGFATAAGAVLAVGIAWRGIDSRQPDLPRSSEPAAPSMQPAFKTESAAPARDTRDPDAAGRVERDHAAEPVPAVVPAAAPTLSSADWESPGSARELQRQAAADSKQTTLRSRVPNQADREARNVAAPTPFPAAPGASTPVSEAEVRESARPDARSANATNPAPMDKGDPAFDEQIAAPALAQPEPAPPPEVAETAEMTDSAGARQESRAFGAPGKETNPARVGAAPAAPAAVARPGAQATVGSLGAVTEQGIHAGTTSLTDAVAAARGALARGHLAETRRLCRAIVARFGAGSLPDDLRAYAQN